VIPDGGRTPLPRDVVPGMNIEVEQEIRAPLEPGLYVLELDLVRERVSWFSRKRNSSPCRGTVEVSSVTAIEYTQEP
jgi:hypothetical protein